MGKAAIIGVIAMIIYAATQNTSILDGLGDSQDTVTSHQHEVLARNIAQTGFNIGKQRLADSFVDEAFGGSFENGTYNVSIDVTGDEALITSVGSIVDAHGDTVQRTLEAKVIRNGTPVPTGSVPPFMEYMLLADDDLDIRGNIDGDVAGDGNMPANMNASVHTNGHLYINGNTATIRGFGTYVTGASSNPRKALQNTFTPYYNPDGLAGAYQVGEIELPAFEADEAAAKVTVDQSTSSTLRLSGNLSFGGTRTDPYVYHIDGDLEFSGTTTLDGYTVFLVSGAVDFSDDVRIGTSGYTDSAESSIAIYTEGDINIGGNTFVEAQLYAAGDIVFLRGTTQYTGTLAANGEVHIRGTPNLFYRPASPALTTVFNDDDPMLTGVWFREQ